MDPIDTTNRLPPLEMAREIVSPLNVAHTDSLKPPLLTARKSIHPNNPIYSNSSQAHPIQCRAGQESYLRRAS
jgi:hypothetical protein